MMIKIFGDVTLCFVLNHFGRFGKQWRHLQQLSRSFSVDYSTFDDKIATILRNAENLLPDVTASHPRRLVTATAVKTSNYAHLKCF